MKCRKRIRRCRNRGVPLPPGPARENPEACPSGIRHVGGAKLNQALVRNVRTCSSDAKGDVQAAHTARTRVPKRSTGAEQASAEDRALGGVAPIYSNGRAAELSAMGLRAASYGRAPRVCTRIYQAAPGASRAPIALVHSAGSFQRALSLY